MKRSTAQGDGFRIAGLWIPSFEEKQCIEDEGFSYSIRTFNNIYDPNPLNGDSTSNPADAYLWYNNGYTNSRRHILNAPNSLEELKVIMAEMRIGWNSND